MGKIKLSKKPFEGKKKASWNKGISKNKNTKKIFPSQRKDVSNSYNLGKSCFDH